MQNEKDDLARQHDSAGQCKKEIVMLTVEDARARVAKGATLLDQKRPGWAGLINVGTLCLNSCTGCVLGQMFQVYDAGRTVLGMSLLEASELGFHRLDMSTWDWLNFPRPAEEAKQQWDVLQDAWIEAIADRVVPSVPETAVEPAVLVGAVARTQNVL